MNVRRSTLILEEWVSIHTTPFGAEMSAVGALFRVAECANSSPPAIGLPGLHMTIKRVHLKYDHHSNTMKPMPIYDSFVHASEATWR